MRRGIVSVVLISLVSVCSYAQPSDPGDNPDASTPIDGGVSALAVAGVGYAIKKMKDTRKKKNGGRDTNCK